MHLAVVCATQNSLSLALEELHLGLKQGGLEKSPTVPVYEGTIQELQSQAIEHPWTQTVAFQTVQTFNQYGVYYLQMGQGG